MFMVILKKIYTHVLKTNTVYNIYQNHNDVKKEMNVMIKTVMSIEAEVINMIQ